MSSSGDSYAVSSVALEHSGGAGQLYSAALRLRPQKMRSGIPILLNVNKDPVAGDAFFA